MISITHTCSKPFAFILNTIPKSIASTYAPMYPCVWTCQEGHVEVDLLIEKGAEVEYHNNKVRLGTVC